MQKLITEIDQVYRDFQHLTWGSPAKTTQTKLILDKIKTINPEILQIDTTQSALWTNSISREVLTQTKQQLSLNVPDLIINTLSPEITDYCINTLKYDVNNIINNNNQTVLHSIHTKSVRHTEQQTKTLTGKLLSLNANPLLLDRNNCHVGELSIKYTNVNVFSHLIKQIKPEEKTIIFETGSTQEFLLKYINYFKFENESLKTLTELFSAIYPDKQEFNKFLKITTAITPEYFKVDFKHPFEYIIDENGNSENKIEIENYINYFEKEREMNIHTPFVMKNTLRTPLAHALIYKNLKLAEFFIKKNAPIRTQLKEFTENIYEENILKILNNLPNQDPQEITKLQKLIIETKLKTKPKKISLQQ
jgi:hypothetical protein